MRTLGPLRTVEAGGQQIAGDLARRRHLIGNLVASGSVTGSPGRQFEASNVEFNAGPGKMVPGLTGTGQYLDSAATSF